MPRRGRAREYDEEDMYEVERDVYPRRGRDERFFEEDIRYKRRGSEGLPLDKLERLHLEAQRKPEILREPHGYPRDLAPPILRREPEDLEPPRERPRRLKKDWDEQPLFRGRPRSRDRDIEEEITFREETDRRYTDSESDSDIVLVPRKERPVHRRRYDIPEAAPKPRSRSLLEERRLREMDFKQGDVRLRRPEVEEHHRRHRSGPFYESIDDADDELDEEVDEEEVSFWDPRERRPERSVEEKEIIFERRERSSSPEIAIPRVPSPGHGRPIRDGFRTKPSMSRAHSPEITLTEAEFRERERRRKGRRDKEEVLILRREEEEFPQPRRDKVVPIVDPPRPRSVEREKERLTVIRRDGSRESLVEEEFEEEDFYRLRGHRTPPRKDIKTMEELDIVRAEPKEEKRTEIVTQEIKPSRYGDRESKLVVKDVKESDNIPERQLGRIGRRYVGLKDRRDGLWTEITKDLIVREALERSGYEYEETESFYYIFSYLEQNDVDALIERSEEIRRARRRRIQEIHRERASLPRVAAPPPPPPLIPAAEKAAPLLLDNQPPPPRFVRDERRKKERDMVVEGNRWRGPQRPGRW
ncbi:uncharacterized protein BO88DRAFT_364212 [Aspergillus vadensis CBS 113365]|uniref:DUF8035 domain-containing protein n=1 Tax=Aspergillus vadensis (strain CBS 113365 / IMI 142717 / IBT 24658) TaxID=1448311 RepID=A0A319BD48_ASPVC|nr:hypothetical protein BO88DRAFT_364212 [Aspergillus vadensis CBS 113365]PYH70001.1 hypothetical protein BO88DRAFT_364212 [Aspergillus vadensis CBS 113365]